MAQPCESCGALAPTCDKCNQKWLYRRARWRKTKKTANCQICCRCPRNRFARFRCSQCGSSSMINFSWEPCLECQNIEYIWKTTSSTVFIHFDKIFRIPQIPLQTTATFLQWNDSHKQFKRRYLYIMLLAPESAFRQLTLFFNEGMASIYTASIYYREGAIGRILSFVV